MKHLLKVYGIYFYSFDLLGAIPFAVHILFQNLDYTTVTPVRYKRLADSCNGICVSNQWLVASLNQTVRVYSLPHLDPGQEIQISSPRYPRAEDDGSIYVPGTEGISILKIHDTGNVTLVRNLTGGGSVTNVRAVALGPLKGELCVAFRDKLLILNIEDDTVARSLESPRLMSVHSLAVDSGQILVTYRFNKDRLYDLIDMAIDGRNDWFDGHDWLAGVGRRGYIYEDGFDIKCFDQYHGLGRRPFLHGRRISCFGQQWEPVRIALSVTAIINGIPGYCCRAATLRLELDDLSNIPSQILQMGRKSLINVMEQAKRIQRYIYLGGRRYRCGYDSSFSEQITSVRLQIEQEMSDLSQPAHLALYAGSVLTSPLLTTDSLAGITASNGRFFVVDNQHSNVHIYNTTGSLRYTIESVNGRHGLWLTGLTDVAVWQDCLWLVAGSGHLVLLCPA